MREVADISLKLGLDPVLVGSNLASGSIAGGGSEGQARRENHGAIRDTGREEFEAASGKQELG